MAQIRAEISEKLRPSELVMKGAIFRGGVTPPHWPLTGHPMVGGAIRHFLHYSITSQIFADVQLVVF